MIIIYHGNCFDGFGAAWAAKKVYPDAKFHPANHGDHPPIVEGQDVLILDFSYPLGQMESIEKEAKSLRVFDHHKTAQDILKDKPYAVFDMNRSGAMITWDELIGGPAPYLIQYIQDKDLWQWKLGKSKEINATIASFPKDFHTWDMLELALNSSPSDVANVGSAILRFQSQKVDEICQNVIWQDIGGYLVPTVNSPLFMSEVCDRLCELYTDTPFAAYYFDRLDGTRQWGMRSWKGFDVSVIAKLYKGGGHAAAAGFQTKTPKSKLIGSM